MIFGQVIQTSDFSIQINQKSVLSLLGYKHGKTRLSETAGKVLESAFNKAESLIHPNGVYRVEKIKDKSNGIITFSSPALIFKGKSISRLLSSSFAAVLTAVTIGPELEEASAEKTQSGQLEQALAFDVIGSEAVEAAAESLNFYLISLARQEKLFLTKRYSPGYGDFALKNQMQFFDILSLSDLGISIDDNYMLTPRKTITAVLGVNQ